MVKFHQECIQRLFVNRFRPLECHIQEITKLIDRAATADASDITPTVFSNCNSESHLTAEGLRISKMTSSEDFNVVSSLCSLDIFHYFNPIGVPALGTNVMISSAKGHHNSDT